MNDLIRAELLKFRTTRSSQWMVASALLAVLMAVALAIASAGHAGNVELHTTEGIRNVLSAGASSRGLIVLILGIVSMTGEHRFQTVTQAFLTSPRRSPVVGAKLAATAVLGVVVGLASAVGTMAVALPWLAREGASPRLVADIGPVVAGTLAATVLYGVLGVALGAVLRNQAVAVTLALVWFLLVEGWVRTFLHADVGRWLPGGALTALSAGTVHAGKLLPMWAAGLLLVGYASALALAGIRFVLRRDVA